MVDMGKGAAKAGMGEIEMKVLTGSLLILVGYAWLIWSGTLATITMFLYLGTGDDPSDARLSYGLSILGLVPIVGGIAASFMSERVHGWGLGYAALNFLGWLLPVTIGIALGRSGTALSNAQPVVQQSPSRMPFDAAYGVPALSRTSSSEHATPALGRHAWAFRMRLVLRRVGWLARRSAGLPAVAAVGLHPKLVQPT
jgi:hypothetical protein